MITIKLGNTNIIISIDNKSFLIPYKGIRYGKLIKCIGETIIKELGLIVQDD